MNIFRIDDIYLLTNKFYNQDFTNHEIFFYNKIHYYEHNVI